MQLPLQQRRNNISVKSIILIAILIIVAGCSEQPVTPVSQTPASKAAGEVTQNKQNKPTDSASAVESGTAEDGRTEYTYRTAGRRDPFRSLILGLKEKKVAGLTPLQLRSLGELKVIGIMWAGKSYSAMIETPDGKGYLVQEGVFVGPEGGVVKNITADSVTIEEVFTDIYGKKKTKKTVLGLRPKEEAVDEDI